MDQSLLTGRDGNRAVDRIDCHRDQKDARDFGGQPPAFHNFLRTEDILPQPEFPVGLFTAPESAG